LPGRSAYILDQHQQLVPIGVTGELHLGGAGLARGYLNSPDATAARFVPNPFEEGALMYRTGDLARYLPDGTMEFVGRADNQIKVRGFRVELGDIEATLRRHPAVSDAAVVTRRDRAGEQRLIAYVAAAAHGQQVSRSELRTFAATYLPEYMVPHAIVPLDKLPTSAIGKLDRHALPDPSGFDADIGYAAPRNETERLLSLIWCDVLGRPRVDIHDNFFDAGGHSLSAIRAAFRIHDVFQLDTPLQWIFQCPTIATLAEQISVARNDRSGLLSAAILPRPRGGPAPLTVAQEDFLAFDRVTPQSQLFNVYRAVRLTGRVDEHALTNSFADLIGRHEALRTTFHVVDGAPQQQVAPPAPFSLEVFELGSVPLADRDATLELIVKELRYRRFDLTAAPLLHAALVHLGDADSVVVISSHHIVFDGWSLDLVQRDLAAIYAARMERRSPLLPPLPVSYIDFAVWQRQMLHARRDALLGYWRAALVGDLVPLELAVDRLRRRERTFIYGRVRTSLSDTLLHRLHELGRDTQATLYIILTTALKAALHLKTGQSDIRVATMTAGRTRAELENVVGLFINTVILRSAVSADSTIRQLLARVRATVLGAMEHEDLPFAMLREALVAERQLDPAHLAQVLLVFDQHALPALSPTAGLAPAPMPVMTEEREAVFSSYELIVEVVEGPPLTVLLKYDADLYDATTGEDILRAFVTVIEYFAAHPDDRLSDLAR
jgi:non-ribosomal peptide synthetase component F